jgi:rubrerythrin
MEVDSASANKLASVAREVGAEVLEGELRYSAKTGRRHLGDVDLSLHLDRFRDQRLMVVLAPLARSEEQTFACGVCGFVMDEVQDCPRCQLILEYTTEEIDRRIKERLQLFEDLEA